MRISSRRCEATTGHLGCCNVGFIELLLSRVLSAVNSIAVIGGMFTVMVTATMLAVQRQREKYHDRY